MFLHSIGIPRQEINYKYDFNEQYQYITIYGQEVYEGQFYWL